MVKKVSKLLVVVALALLVGCTGYIAVVTALSGRPVALPALTGPHQVGRTAFEWTDHSRVDPLAGDGGPRRLAVWLWYPATGSGEPAEYMPGLWRKQEFGGVVGWFETDFENIRVHAVADAPIAEGRFPLVVLSPGMGFSASQYTAIAEDLASHGYLVAGVTPTYSANVSVLDGKLVESTPDGNPQDLGGHSGAALAEGNSLVDLWAAGARFVAGQVAGLTGRFASRTKPGVAYLGHSFGGAASLEACRLDRSCVGAVDLDGTQFGGVVEQGLRVPFMILSSEDSCVTGTCGPKATNPDGEQAAAASLVKASSGESVRYIVHGARHFDFTDYAVYFLAPPISNLVGMGSIDGQRALAIENHCLSAFLDHVTQGTPLGAPAQDYPELTAA
jgi:predicted dienelactone hydrolase